MDALSIYLTLSALALLWQGSIWSSTGLANISIKFGLVALALFGAIMAARALSL